MNHNNAVRKGVDLELILYSLFSVILVSIVFYLFYYDPVNYTRLISEDNFAEYGTSASFTIAGVLLLILSFKRGPVARRIMWGLIGMLALLIAAEEISWGQRILSVGTPNILAQQNLQGEITLHNLAAFDSVNKKLHLIASCLILAYLFFSIVVSIYLPRLEEKLVNIGLPPLPTKLIPVFLLAPLFFIFYPTSKSDEVGEFFLGIAVLMWTVDLFFGVSGGKRVSAFVSIQVMAGTLIVAAIMSVLLTYSYAGGISGRLNMMASRDYPERGMYEQSQKVFTYIYENAKHLNYKTRVNHAKMLQQFDRYSEAQQILSQEVSELEARQLTEAVNSDLLRHLGVVYMLQSGSELANDYFDQAVKIDSKLLDMATSSNVKANLLWSISKTQIEQGKIAAAITNMKRAIEHSNSSAFRFKLEEQVKRLEEAEL